MQILRPPLTPSFELPSREELLDVRPGDFIKLSFADDDGFNVERMWVQVTSTQYPRQWVGTLNNIPFDPVALGLDLDDEIRFHPLDVIAVMKELKRVLKGE